MIASREGKVPEYPRWFVRPVQRWLHQQYQKEGMFFLDNAWDDDKNRLKVSKPLCLLCWVGFKLLCSIAAVRSS